METTSQPATLSINNAAFIKYPRLMKLHEEIKACMELSKTSSEPQCMSIEGEPGIGKSTLVTDYVSLYPRQKTSMGDIIPVFYSQLPSPATPKGAASEMLRKLGDPGHARGSLWSMNSRLIGLIKDCRVELIILDEFSNLIDTDTNHVLHKVSDWLKMLIKETNVPFVVVGIAGKMETVLSSNPQLSRLFAYRESLDPFSWTTQEKVDEFAKFLLYAEKAIGFPLTTSVPKVELYYRIYYASDGIVGNVMNMLRWAARNAQRNGHSATELTDLSVSFEEHMEKHMKVKVNPFDQPADVRFVTPKVEKIKSEQKNNVRPSIAATLSAG